MAPKKKVSVPTLFELWHSNINTKELCARLSISDSHLRRLVKQYKLPTRKISNNGKAKMVDPTPEELAQRMLETRAGWSEKEANNRYCGRKREDWRVPSYAYDARTGNFTRD